MGKRYGRQLLALLLVCAMILPNRLADAIGTGAMQAEAVDTFFTDNSDIYYYWDGSNFWYKDGLTERSMQEVTGTADWLTRTTSTVNAIKNISVVQDNEELNDAVVKVTSNVSGVVKFSMEGIAPADIKWGKSIIFFDYEVAGVGGPTMKTASLDFYLIRMIAEPSPDPSVFPYTGETYKPFERYMSDPRWFNTYYKFASGTYEASQAGEYSVTFELVHPEYTAWFFNCGYGDRNREESKEAAVAYTKKWTISKSGIAAPAAPLPAMFNKQDPTRVENDNGYIHLRGDAAAIDPNYADWGLLYFDAVEGKDVPFDGSLDNLGPGVYKFRYGDDNHENVSDYTEIELLPFNPRIHVEITGSAEFDGTLTASVLGADVGDISDHAALIYDWDSTDADGNHVDVTGFVNPHKRSFTVSNANLVGKYLKVTVTCSSTFTLEAEDSYAIVYIDMKSADSMGEPQVTKDMKFLADGNVEDGEILLSGPGAYEYCIGNNFTLGETDPSYIPWDTPTDGMKIPVDAQYYKDYQENAESRLVYYIRRRATATTRASVSVAVSVYAKYEVKLQANGGKFADGLSAEKSGFVKWGQYAAEWDGYEEPAQDDKDFSGWFTDAGCTVAYDIDAQHVEAPVTLYADWTLKPRPALQGKILIERKVALAPGEVTRICYATDAIAEFIEAEHPREPFDATKEKLQYSWCSVESAVYDAGGIDWDTYDGGTNGWTEWNDDSTYTPGKDDVGNRVVCRVRALENPGENPRREHYLIGSALVYKREIQITLTAVAPPIEKVYDGTDIGPASLVKASISDEELDKLPTADKKWGITVAIDPARSEDAVHFLTDEFVGNKKLAVYAEDLLLDWAHPGQDLDDKGRGPAAFYEPVMANELDAKIVAARQKLTIKPGSELDYTVSRSQHLTEANILASVTEKLDLSLCYGKLQLTMDGRTDAASGTTSSGWKWEMDATGSYEYTAASSAGKSAVFRVGIKSANVGGDDEPEYEE
ncbi:MAG: InlB B-repeat-containing protein, partial [Lachnospiraceae bacterium]|nr:InlB B-repeat-containing protein [Lachnospiraceae bacterium]